MKRGGILLQLLQHITVDICATGKALVYDVHCLLARDMEVSHECVSGAQGLFKVLVHNIGGGTYLVTQHHHVITLQPSKFFCQSASLGDGLVVVVEPLERHADTCYTCNGEKYGVSHQPHERCAKGFDARPHCAQCAAEPTATVDYPNEALTKFAVQPYGT